MRSLTGINQRHEARNLTKYPIDFPQSQQHFGGNHPLSLSLIQAPTCRGFGIGVSDPNKTASRPGIVHASGACRGGQHTLMCLSANEELGDRQR
jgi:hypothetical protein